MMREKNDWRLSNQLNYLQGITLTYRPYAPASATNDHDHCEFCFAKFISGGSDQGLNAGYSSIDAYRWICEECYEDFADLFEWRLVKQA